MSEQKSLHTRIIEDTHRDVDEVQVRLEELVDPRLLNLEDHLLAALERGRVDLGDTRAGQRCHVDGREVLTYGAQLRLDDRLDDAPLQRLCRIQTLLEFNLEVPSSSLVEKRIFLDALNWLLPHIPSETVMETTPRTAPT